MMSGCCASLCAALVLGQAFSDGAASRVAVINIAEVFDKYEMTKGLEEQFERQRQALAERAQLRRDEMETKRRALLEQFKPDTAEFEERQAELERMQVDYEVWAGVEEKRLKKQHKHWLITIYRNVREQVRLVAEARGIDVVLTYDTLTEDAPDSQTLRQQILFQKVIYSSPRADLTREVIERLNDEFQKHGGPGSIRLGAPDTGGASARPESNKPKGSDKP